jgi:hypothetical protein
MVNFRSLLKHPRYAFSKSFMLFGGGRAIKKSCKEWNLKKIMQAFGERKKFLKLLGMYKNIEKNS